LHFLAVYHYTQIYLSKFVSQNSQVATAYASPANRLIFSVLVQELVQPFSSNATSRLLSLLKYTLHHYCRSKLFLLLSHYHLQFFLFNARQIAISKIVNPLLIYFSNFDSFLEASFPIYQDLYLTTIARLFSLILRDSKTHQVLPKHLYQ